MQMSAALSPEEDRLWNIVRANSLDFDAWIALPLFFRCTISTSNEYQHQQWSNLSVIYKQISEHPNQQLDQYFNR